MSNDLKDEPRLDTVTQLKEWMVEGCKPPQNWRIGTEHEKLGFHKQDLTPLAYEGTNGIRAMLDGLTQFGWQPQFEGDKVIALTRAQKLGGGSITLEPGGQLELSGAPLKTLHQTYAELTAHLKEVRAIADELGQAYLGIGFSPLWGLFDVQAVPKNRYALMREYMPKRGKRGLDMMYLSATVQVNLDFSSETDMVEKFRIALALQPLATALFANSPFREGKLTNHQSERSLAWLDTDPDRTGMLPFAFKSGFGFEQYVDYALNVPMYFIIRNGTYINALGQDFRAFLRGELPALPGEKPTAQDWENHLTTLFPEARVKRFIEMRGADSGPPPIICALSAFWVGLLYDATAQKKAIAYIADWTAKERADLRSQAPIYGLETPFRGKTLLDMAHTILSISAQGLKARAQMDSKGNDESLFLEPLNSIAGDGKNWAARLRTKFLSEWNEDIRPIFTENAF